MRKKKILVTLSTFGESGREPIALLEKSGFEYKINALGKRLVPEEIISMGHDCAGVIAGIEPYNDYVLSRMPELVCISRCGVGIDNIDISIAAEKGIVIRTTPDAVAKPVGELTLGLMLDLLRNLAWQSSRLKEGKWERKTGHLLYGKTVGIFGLGRIGKRVAELCVAFGACVIGTDIRSDDLWARQTGVMLVNFDELLKRSDILSIHISHTGGQPVLLGRKEIAGMRKGAILINTARGKFVDEDALYEALKSGYLGGAGLDVFNEEPYTGKLRDLETVILTPHVGTLTHESRLAMEIEATNNLIDQLSKTA